LPSTWPAAAGHTLASEIAATTWASEIHPCLCDALIGFAGPILAPAEIHDEATGRLVQHPVRRALQASLQTYRQTLSMHALERILAHRAGLPWTHTECLNVLFYREGDYYAPHADYFSETSKDDVADLELSGQRQATALVSLHAAEAGGATHFPHLKTSWNGKEGDILIFQNLTAEGGPNPISWHEGQTVTPPLENRLQDLWIRTKPYHGDLNRSQSP
jgi:prolyl 4-hydroxylase